MQLTKQQIKKEIENLNYSIQMDYFTDRINFDSVERKEKEVKRLEKLLTNYYN